MIFPSDKKKELWRYASKNNPSACDGAFNQLPLPHHLPHQYHIQTVCCNQLISPDPEREEAVTNQKISFPCCCANIASTPITMVIDTTKASNQNLSLNTPPPPYTSVALPFGRDIETSVSSINYHPEIFFPFRHQMLCATHGPTNSVSLEKELSDFTDIPQNKRGCDYERSGKDMAGDATEKSIEIYFPSRENFFQTLGCQEHNNYATPALEYSITNSKELSMSQTMTPTFATTAANMFRNCCGRGFSSQSTSSPLKTNRISRSPASQIYTKTLPEMNECSVAKKETTKFCVRTVTQDFNGLMKKLKQKQIAELLRAVKSRLEPTHLHSGHTLNDSNCSPCILIKRTTENVEEQHVTACRLFFWSDLYDANQLKSSPTCPSKYDPIFVCCNPLHWYRIIETELPPPPYRQIKMKLIKNPEENDQKTDKIYASISSNPTSAFERVAESLTTVDEDRRVCAVSWCQIAYWELAQRVGAFFRAKRPLINIYSEGTADLGIDNMCLKDLTPNKAAPDTVQHIRKKIGLGVTLTLDVDCVWVYNRTTIPIFIDSPTLSERLDRVCKVMPGYCLKAFDTKRARTQDYDQYSCENQMGPIDRFSLKISFAKGWGYMYRRQDIMGCPCWLEVHLNQLR